MPDTFIGTYPTPHDRSNGLRCVSAAFDMSTRAILYKIEVVATAGDDKVSPLCENHGIVVTGKDHALTNRGDNKFSSNDSTLMFQLRIHRMK
ncbi:unnamed protein product [Clonostachys rosea f. rosea IK726]|uniref:Uncharacterized protein n=1 Tax=Clonostachys rosea f. rosea IK726 TaxID=1349383 RepID=A0ACA9UP82_BIOOC|nr:unnamed protein product [Clonostachys rosea f. rosea IK726]